MYPSQNLFPFRLGTTSYIIPDDILPNARFLSSRVDDIELVLFELDDGPSNLPDQMVRDALNTIAAAGGLTYTVHLPLDLRLGSQGQEQHVSLVKARQVIEATRNLSPWAYVLHLDGREVRNSRDPQELADWQNQAVRALEITSGYAGGAERLAVENLEGYPLDFWEPVFERIAVSRCVDIGHLWLDGHDPLPYLERTLSQTRVIHLHGIGERDHQSLRHVPEEQLVRVIAYLVTQNYQGVLTLEIFNEDDLNTSLEALRKSLENTHG